MSMMHARLPSEASMRFGPISRAPSNMSGLQATDLSYFHLASPTRAGSTLSVASDIFGPASSISSLEVATAYSGQEPERAGKDLKGVSIAWPQGMASAGAAAPVALSQSVGLEEYDFQTPPWGRSLSALG